MDLSFLPKNYIKALNSYKIEKVYELRLRVGYPVILKSIDKINFLNEYGQVYSNNVIICKQIDIDTIIDNVTERSIYAYNDRIKDGYITTKCGIRVGLSGEVVKMNGQVVTIKNITSLNIRFPHEIKGCSNDVFNYVYRNGKIFNTLIISPPTCGKTTLLKDLCVKLNDLNCGDILIIDERAEFENVNGVNIDKIRYSDKLYAFNYAIRSMAPQIVVTDELSSEEDWLCAKSAVNSGIKIIASCHSSGVYELKNKQDFIGNVFERYVILKSDGSLGVTESVFDGDYKLL